MPRDASVSYSISTPETRAVCRVHVYADIMRWDVPATKTIMRRDAASTRGDDVATTVILLQIDVVRQRTTGVGGDGNVQATRFGERRISWGTFQRGSPTIFGLSAELVEIPIGDVMLQIGLCSVSTDKRNTGPQQNLLARLGRKFRVEIEIVAFVLLLVRDDLVFVPTPHLRNGLAELGVEIRL